MQAHAAKQSPRPNFARGVSPAYASNLSRLLGRSRLWVHGHIHDNMDYSFGMTRVLCNPRGYTDPSGEHMNGLFQPDLVVEV